MSDYSVSWIAGTKMDGYSGRTAMNPKHSQQKVEGRWLEIEEVRVVSDVRIMHSKVTDLHQLVQFLKQRHDEAAVVNYADLGSYACIYRTLKTLVACGLAVETKGVDGAMQYQNIQAPSNHTHLVCKDCGAVLEHWRQ